MVPEATALQSKRQLFRLRQVLTCASCVMTCVIYVATCTLCEEPGAQPTDIFREGMILTCCCTLIGGKMILTCCTYQLNMYLKISGGENCAVAPSPGCAYAYRNGK